MRTTRLIAAAALLAVAFVLRPAVGQDEDVPVGHFTITNPASLTKSQAEAIYQKVFEQMARGYQVSHRREAMEYVKWTRYNTAPYVSATHGARYVSNYANAKAKAYAKYENAGTFPVGAIIAKNSFTATDDGQLHAGPLFTMEKMPASFNAESGDWKYVMIMPDGSFFGETNGEGSENVRFCIGCHAAMQHQDHLFFIPDEYRSVGLTAN